MTYLKSQETELKLNYFIYMNPRYPPFFVVHEYNYSFVSSKEYYSAW